jgi:galactonate dehydratase
MRNGPKCNREGALLIRNGAMRITRVSTTIVNAEMRNWVFVRVDTDSDGLYGWGESTCEWKTRAVAGAIGDLEPLLIGRDPRDIEQLVRVMKKHSFWRLGIIGMSAISGVEIALWDILGKFLNQPVWRLLGGKVRDRVKVYTHLGLGDMRAVYESNQVDPIVERALEVVGRGYKALKAVFIPYTHYHAPLPEVNRVAQIMQGLRKAVGDDIEIMVDFHGRPASIGAALAYIQALEQGRPMFVEEVLPPGDAPAMARVAAQTKVPLACGECLVQRSEFDELFRLRAIDIAQPDICHVAAFLRPRRLQRWPRRLLSELLRITRSGPSRMLRHCTSRFRLQIT